MRVLLKNSVMPSAVKAAPEERKIMPTFRFPDVKTVGSFDLDGEEGLRRCCLN